jgi:hypothetical protein
MVVGSPDVSNISVNPVEFVLNGHRAIVLPPLTREEWYEVFQRVIDKIRPHLKSLCIKTFGDWQKEHVFLQTEILYSTNYNFDRRTKCLHIDFLPSPGVYTHNHIFIHRNGSVFVIWLVDVGYGGNEKWKINRLTHRFFQEKAEKDIERIIHLIIEGLRDISNSFVYSLRNRAAEHENDARWLSQILDRLP